MISYIGSGKLWTWGTSRTTGTVLSRSKNPEVVKAIEETVIQVSCGLFHNVILCEDKNGSRILYTCGSNELGQCGIGGRTGPNSTVDFPHTVGFFHEANDIRVEKIVAGYEHSLALSKDGIVCHNQVK